MHISKRRAAVIATALVLGGACVAAQPAIAKDPTGSIDSREIKDKTIRPKDLKPPLLVKINLGATALQEVLDASITTEKLADNAVTSPKIADNAVTTSELADNAVSGSKLADNSVGAAEVTDGSIGAPEIGPNAINSEELANDSVDGGAVANGSLQAIDIASVRGITNLNYGVINANSCGTLQVNTGNVLDGDLILVTAGSTMPGIITINARQAAAGSSNISFVACNGAAVALNPGATDISWAIIEN
jgi:hypothetical protein